MLETLVVTILFNTLIYTIILALISVGLNMILGVLKILNVAHGAFFALGAYTSVTLVKIFLTGGLPIFTTYIALILAGVLSGLIVGILIEPTILRRIYTRIEVYQLLVTYSLALIIEDLIKFIWGPEAKIINEPYLYLGTLNIGGVFYPTYYIFLIIVGSIILFTTYVFLNTTYLGKIIYATAFDKEISLTMGVNVNKIYTYSFIIGTMLTTLGGALMSPTLSLQPGFSSEYIVIAFAIIVIGGLGSVKGAFLASTITALARSITIIIFPELELAILFMIMVTVLLIKPTGLFGG
ncbi:MAG: branched-chain amino acid ABC transporter permease [Thermofilaceae archaeon]